MSKWPEHKGVMLFRRRFSMVPFAVVTAWRIVFKKDFGMLWFDSDTMPKPGDTITIGDMTAKWRRKR